MPASASDIRSATTSDADDPSGSKLLYKCIGQPLNKDGDVVTQEMVDSYLAEGYSYDDAVALADLWDAEPCVAAGVAGREFMEETSES